MPFSSTIPILTFILVLLMSNVITVTSSKSSNLIEQTCYTYLLSSADSKLCVQILGSQPKIVSARCLYDMLNEILRSGIASATNTRTHIEKLLLSAAVGPSSKDALQGCKAAHDRIISTFKWVPGEVKIKQFLSANYDLLIGSTDNFRCCLADVAAGKIKDPTILRGNVVTRIYGLSAAQAVGDIPIKSSPGCAE